MKNIYLLSLFFLIFFAEKINATHAAGMDISYECISQGTNSDTYKVTLKFYRDCEGIDAPGYGINPLLQLEYSSSCGSGTATLQTVGSPININPLCLSYCNGGNSLGIEQYTYEAIISLSKCSNWSLTVCEPARNNAINTIVNPGNQDLCIEATLDNTIYCNNSPTFSQYPTPFICAGNYYCYNNGAIEIDGDSLVYTLVTPLNTNNGGTVNYIAPYSVTNPVGGGSTFDQITGNLCVTPPGIITGVLAIKVSEFRNGILIGSIIRDIQINSFACNGTNPPELTGINSNNLVDISDINSYTFNLDCPNGNQTISFDINTINNNPTPPPGYEIFLNVGGGSWQSEVSWEIYDPSGPGAGTIIASGGAPYNGSICIPSSNIGNLEFIMYDSWGDGWNGNTYTISGNNTLSGTLTGSLFNGSYGVNNFNLSGGSSCAIGGSLVNMTWNSGITNANFTVSNNNSMNPIGTFSWTPTPSDILGSPYFFTVEVANDACPVPGNFSFQYQINLTQSNITVNPTIINPSCNGLSNGQINTQIIGSNPPYTYNWSNGVTTQSLSNVGAGIYDLTITDSLGCIKNESFNLIEPPIFSPIINSNNISCFGANDGFIQVVNEPSSTTYLWSNLSTNSSISNLSSGNYSVNVTDSNGCVLTEFFNISEPNEIIVSSTFENVSCNGNNDGNINLNISGGISDYTVNLPPFFQVLSNGISSFSTQNTLGPGTYNYSVIDSNNCTVSNTIIINEPDQLLTNPIISNVLCKSEANGSIILNIFGGTSPYTENFYGNLPLQLSAGNYSYLVTDSNGCSYSETFVITEPDSLLSFVSTSDATCAGYSDGYANLTITGGTLPYNTNWFNSNPNNLNAGTHYYLITDNNGCQNQDSIVINEPFGMQVNVNTTPVSCFGGNDGSANLVISGGAGYPYNTYWGGVNPDSLSAGFHIVTIADSNNCSLTDTIQISQPAELIINPLTNDVSCFGDNDGHVSLQIIGGIPPYTETWFGYNPIQLAPGIYSYQVSDSNNCIKNGDFVINEPDTIISNAIINHVTCFEGSDGSVLFNISGGTSPFNIDFGIFNQNQLTAGNYTFTITDNNGCDFDSLIQINEPDEVLLDFIATSPICRNDKSTLSINLSNTNLNSFIINLLDSINKSYIIDTNGLLIPEGLAIQLQPFNSGKVYFLSIIDEKGCEQFFDDFVHIEVKPLPELYLNEDDICLGEESYTLNSAIPEGGTYYIDGFMNNFFDVENLDFGDYIIKYEYTDPITLCSNKTEDVITISDSPKADMNFGPQPTDIENSEILFYDNSNEDISYSEWDLGDGTIIYNELYFSHTYLDTGSYTVKYYITNEYQCTDSVISQVKINPMFYTFIPNSFTPNNDNDNDLFFPSIIGHKNYNLKIYNRWGELIFDEDNGSWNGKINGQKAQIGTYSYSISVVDFNDRLFIYPGIFHLLE